MKKFNLKSLKVIISIFMLTYTFFSFIFLSEFINDYSSFKLVPSLIFISPIISVGILKKHKGGGLLFPGFIAINFLHAYKYIPLSDDNFIMISLILGVTIALFMLIHLLKNVKKTQKNLML